MSAQWNGADTGSIIARLTPCALAISTARSTADLSPDNTTCPPPLSLAAAQTPRCGGFRGDRLGVIELDADERRHGADADRHRLLHGAAAYAQQPRRVGNRERLRGRERRIFAERMAGDEGRVAREIDAGFGFEHAQRRERHRHQRRLRVLGQGQRLRRPVPHRRR